VRVLVLGAGFGGLELVSRLSEEFGDQLDVVLIDASDGFVFGFSKLDVMFGRLAPSSLRHSYRELNKPGVRFVQTRVRSIDPVAKRVVTDAGSFEADVLVIALGADLDPEATPGLVEGGNEFYTVPGALALRDALSRFEGGSIIIGVTSTPFKCPPAPSECALLLHDFLSERGQRVDTEISLVMPFAIPIPPSPEASEALLAAFEERDINWYPERSVRELVVEHQIAILSDGTEMPYDLFLGVPVHRAPAVVEESGLAVDGWIPVDSLTLETEFSDVFAIGDVTSVGTAKAGVFAEGQARVVAAQIAARHRGIDLDAAYDGRGTCYIEFGHDQVGRVDVTFLRGVSPVGVLEGPSPELAADKVAFGSQRVLRWFDRTWSTTD